MERNSWRLIDLPTFYDKVRGGSLVVAEIYKVTEDLFEAARRVYFIINTEERQISRGGHYHPANGKQEFWFVPMGKIFVGLHGPSQCREGLVIDTPTKALVIPSGVWHGVRLEPRTILVSVASTNYHTDEAISELPPCACKQ